MFLLLFLLELLLLLIVFLFKLLQLLLLALFNLSLPLRVGVFLFHLLALLNLLLLDPLALLVLFGTHILKFLLVLLFELRVDGARIASVARIVRARNRRPIIVDLAIPIVRRRVGCRRIAGPVCLSGLIRIALTRRGVGGPVRVPRICVWRRVVGWRIRRVRISLRWPIRIALLHISAGCWRVLRGSLPNRRRHLDVRTRHLGVFPLNLPDL